MIDPTPMPLNCEIIAWVYPSITHAIDVIIIVGVPSYLRLLNLPLYRHVGIVVRVPALHAKVPYWNPNVDGYLSASFLKSSECRSGC